MSYRDCLACKEAKTKPKRGMNIHVVYDPAITMPGTPTIMGHRLSAEMIAAQIYEFGLKAERKDYDLSREEALVACWWAGLYGPRRLKKALGKWAEVAAWHLWYQCINIPAPPQATEAPR